MHIISLVEFLVEAVLINLYYDVKKIPLDIADLGRESDDIADGYRADELEIIDMVDFGENFSVSVACQPSIRIRYIKSREIVFLLEREKKFSLFIFLFFSPLLLLLPYLERLSHHKSSEDFSVQISVLEMHEKVLLHLSLPDVDLIFLHLSVREELVHVLVLLLGWSPLRDRVITLLLSLGLVLLADLVPHVAFVEVLFALKGELRELILLGMVALVARDE